MILHHNKNIGVPSGNWGRKVLSTALDRVVVNRPKKKSLLKGKTDKKMREKTATSKETSAFFCSAGASPTSRKLKKHIDPAF